MTKIIAIVFTLMLVSAPTWAACGSASHYGHGDGFHGRKTASGTIFNKNAMTAAHRTLPFGTVVTVTRGSHSCTMTITDRGPAKWTGRIIDVSYAGAKCLGLIGPGHAKVCF